MKAYSLMTNCSCGGSANLCNEEGSIFIVFAENAMRAQEVFDFMFGTFDGCTTKCTAVNHSDFDKSQKFILIDGTKGV